MVSQRRISRALHAGILWGKRRCKCNRREQTRTYRRVGSLHRDAQGEDEQRHGELSQAIHLRGISQGSACVSALKLYGSLLACHSPVVPPPPSTLALSKIGNSRKNTSSRRAGRSCACRGSWWSWLWHRAPLLSPSNFFSPRLPNLPSRIYFPHQGRADISPMHLHQDRQFI